MGKSGIGVGSASIILVFAVLCLTIFSLITFVVAGNEKSLTDAKVELVKGFYEADALAESVIVEILNSEVIPASINGVDININPGDLSDSKNLYFYIDISDVKMLYVNLLIHENTFDILSRRMYDVAEWTGIDSGNVWTGE